MPPRPGPAPALGLRADAIALSLSRRPPPERRRSMWFSSWLRNGKRSEPGQHRRGRGAARQRANIRSRLEALEDRTLLSGQTYVVHVAGDPVNQFGWAVGSGTS